jgi:hypothetical protein
MQCSPSYLEEKAEIEIGKIEEEYREQKYALPSNLFVELKALTEIIGGDHYDGHLFIILDQFEAYFQRYTQEDTFTEDFAEVVNSASLKVNFLIAIRSDEFYKVEKQFKKHIPDAIRNIELPPLNKEEAKQAIEKPIERYNFIECLRTSRLTVLSGEKGMGKSFILKTGVIPYWRGNQEDKQNNICNTIFFPEQQNDWEDEPYTKSVNLVKTSLSSCLEYNVYFLEIAKLLHDQYFRLLDFYFHTLIQQRRKPIYEGIKFWDKDQFVSERCGLTIDNTPRIVISGSGDGALQDFLRCVTRINSAIHIYNQLFDSILVTRRTNIEAVVQSAEDRARRCLIWASTREQEDCIYQELEDTHKYLISDLLDNDSNIYDNLGDLLEVWLNENAKISLVFRRNYFNNYYSLNRFLVLLIAQYLQDRYRHNHTVLYEKREISSITPEGHRCMRKNSQGTWMPTKEENGTRSCYGREHTVILKDVNDEITTDELTLTANIIIIRHGVNRDSIHSVLNQHKKRCSEIIKKQHLMPYHWPPTGLTVSLF